MFGGWIVIDDIVFLWYIYIYYVMRVRYFLGKVCWWLSGLCVDSGILYFCSIEFDVFFFDDVEVCLWCLRLMWIYGVFIIVVGFGVKCSL